MPIARNSRRVYCLTGVRCIQRTLSTSRVVRAAFALAARWTVHADARTRIQGGTERMRGASFPSPENAFGQFLNACTSAVSWCGWGEPSPTVADFARMSPVPALMWPSPGAGVAAVSPIPVQMWQRRVQVPARLWQRGPMAFTLIGATDAVAAKAQRTKPCAAL